MRTLLIAGGLVAGSFASLAAELPSRRTQPARAETTCAAYGAGFVYVQSANTCIKVGGSVQADYAVSASPPSRR